MASPDLYSTCSLTSKVTVELFANALNESRVQKYSAAYIMNTISLAHLVNRRLWKNVEGGVANPPFDVSIISQILLRFEEGVCSARPYCRIVLLPMCKIYGVETQLSKAKSEGFILVTVPMGFMLFKNEADVLQVSSHYQSQTHSGTLVWLVQL